MVVVSFSEFVAKIVDNLLITLSVCLQLLDVLFALASECLDVGVQLMDFLSELWNSFVVAVDFASQLFVRSSLAAESFFESGEVSLNLVSSLFCISEESFEGFFGFLVLCCLFYFNCWMPSSNQETWRRLLHVRNQENLCQDPQRQTCDQSRRWIHEHWRVH